ncbi:uncharacterized protein LODBEIA_P32440 [Lodderomyces beijingensis]|uniref:Centromere protein H C-terminal domain-containing protein n=1 Tax=Lodderomyces beijingensis TaxID=1775926 RepID=A0ABP0ZP70_9ASCO
MKDETETTTTTAAAATDATDEVKARDQVYLNRLENDIKRVEEHLRQADAAVATFDQDLHESSSIEKRIIALYETYKTIPYKSEKNDTIATAASASILEDMIDAKRKQLSEIEEAKESCYDFAAMVQELTRIRDSKLREKKTLQKWVVAEEEVSSTGKLFAESKEMAHQLQMYLKKVLIQYMAVADSVSGTVSDQSGLQQSLSELATIFNQLVKTNAAPVKVPREYESIFEILEASNLVIRENEYIKLADLD